jgi:hypothetical protein
MPRAREGFPRFPLPPLPAVHAKPQPRSRMPVACARQTRTARMKPMPPWPRNRLTPPDTTNRLWYLILASPIQIMPLLFALAPAKVAYRPSVPSDYHRTVRLAMGERGV